MKPIFCRIPSVLAVAVVAAIVGVAMPLAAQPLTGGPFVLVGAPAAGGTSQGGSYSISGYIASAGAETSSGGNFDLTCGLIAVYLVTSGDVPLSVQLTAAGDVRIWWPADVTGYQLESTTTLGLGATWEPVTPAPAGNEFITSPGGPTRFFRLRATRP